MRDCKQIIKTHVSRIFRERNRAERKIFISVDGQKSHGSKTHMSRRFIALSAFSPSPVRRNPNEM